MRRGRWRPSDSAVEWDRYAVKVAVTCDPPPSDRSNAAVLDKMATVLRWPQPATRHPATDAMQPHRMG
jgi:hypothetical protein